MPCNIKNLPQIHSRSLLNPAASRVKAKALFKGELGALVRWGVVHILTMGQPPTDNKQEWRMALCGGMRASQTERERERKRARERVWNFKWVKTAPFWLMLWTAASTLAIAHHLLFIRSSDSMRAALQNLTLNLWVIQMKHNSITLNSVIYCTYLMQCFWSIKILSLKIINCIWKIWYIFHNVVISSVIMA